MKAILITGRLPETTEQQQLYIELEELLKQYTSTVFTPVQTAAFKGTVGERYERGMQTVQASSLIIAECSVGSTGQGMELRESTTRGVPVIAIHKVGTKPSGMILGMPNLKAVISYTTIAHLIKQVEAEIHKL